MAVPAFYSFLRPVLSVILTHEKHYKDCAIEVAQLLGLSEEDINDPLPSGSTTRVLDRVGWAITYLVKAGLVERPHLGYALATDTGREFFQNHKGEIDEKTLLGFPKYQQFRGKDYDASKGTALNVGNTYEEAAPGERIYMAYDELTRNLRDDLLTAILKAPSDFLEQLIIDLMQAMGYGGPDSGQRLGKTGDHGVDGLINLDLLGLDKIYIQAKCYGPGVTVGEPELRNFAGALVSHGANRGVLVTTSSFTPAARDYVKQVQGSQRIILIDGNELTRLLIEYNVGVVSAGQPLQLRKLDDDYFPKSASSGT